MTEIAPTASSYEVFRKIDRVWLAIAIIFALLAWFDLDQVMPSVRFATGALLHTTPYVLFAMATIAWLKAAGAESVISSAFKGRETGMIIAAALVGGLAPFCSCEVIPFIAGLLALGAPLSAVMAFWLSSPLIDPPSLLITAGALGWTFAIAKSLIAVAMGLMGGFALHALKPARWFDNPLKAVQMSGCGCGPSTLAGKPVWRFWREPERRQVFKRQFLSNGYFLLKWLSLAYVIESLMVHYIPPGVIARILGGDGLLPIILAALAGAPAYLNSYAAPPLVAGLIEQGMSSGAGMAFMVAGAVSSIPAMTAVFALVRLRVFAVYLFLGFAGAVMSGLLFQMLT